MFFNRPSLTSSETCGKRIRSGGSSARTRGAFWVMTANWSSRISHFTFGYCLVNSSARSFGSGKPVSKYPLRVIGAVLHVGEVVGEAPLFGAAVDELLPGALHAAVASSPANASIAI